MGDDPLDELIHSDIRDRDLLNRSYTPRILQLLMVSLHGIDGLRHQAIFRKDWFLERVDKLDRLPIVLNDTQHIGR